MASGFFALLDDIALLMDDVAAMSKVATKKTAGILGDDLAVNAEKAVGFQASRELPVLWAITKGSFLNKLIIVPVAMVLSAYAAWAIEPILLMGGCYLAYEGAEKVAHYLRGAGHGHGKKDTERPRTEQEKIRSAIVVDFVLSVEIVIIALGSVAGAELAVQALSVSVVAVLATLGVYGLVALIVRMDDAGLALMRRDAPALQRIGSGMVRALPKVIQAIGLVGTVALILVSGGIFTHHLPGVHALVHVMPGWLGDLIAGLAVGSVELGLVRLIAVALLKRG